MLALESSELNLPGAAFKHRLRLNECYVADGLDLSEATTRTLGLRGCHVGPIIIWGAKINGLFSLGGAHLDGKDELALHAANLTVTADMLCDREFRAIGEVNLFGASIGGALSFSRAHLDGNDGPPLTARRLTVTTDMYCDAGFQANGEVDLAGARIGNLVDQKKSWPESLNLVRQQPFGL